jgi:hypothetical protein
MRQTISGLVAAVAVMTAGAAPAMACGGGLFQSSCCGQAYVEPCAQPQVYVAPAATYGYSGCNTGCGGWGFDRLADPVQQYYAAPAQQQYYYVNQGPTYTGPGAFAPYPTYQESAVSGWGAYRQRPYHYGYDGGRYADANTHYYDGAGLEGPRVYSYRAHRPWRGYTGYRYSQRPSYRYGYAPHRSYAPRYSLPPRQFYGPGRSMRYGGPVGMPRGYGHREMHQQMMRRYN